MKRASLVAAALILTFVLPAVASAHGGHRGHRGGSSDQPVSSPSKPTPPTTPPITPPVISPTPVIVPTGSEVSVMTYVTGYGYPDNSPPGAGTYINGVSGTAGGTGTYADPITVAVGYVGNTADFPLGTMFYFPFLEKYGAVKDTCAACHLQTNGQSLHLDLWTGGGAGISSSGVLSCEDAITGNYSVIEAPVASLPVNPGSVYNNGTCGPMF